MTTNPARRRMLLAGAAMALAGCGNSPVARTAAAYWDQRGGGDRFTRQQVEQLPYAALAAGLGGGPRAMLVLLRVEGDDLHWVSADKGVLVTRHGRLVKTVGLAEVNLKNTTMLEPDPLARPGSWHEPRQWRRSVDLDPGRDYGITLVCDWQPEGFEEIGTFHGPRRALRIHERCRAPHAGWHVDNRFWLNPESGEVLSSIQQLRPETRSLMLEPLKPYRA